MQKKWHLIFTALFIFGYFYINEMSTSLEHETAPKDMKMGGKRNDNGKPYESLRNPLKRELEEFIHSMDDKLLNKDHILLKPATDYSKRLKNKTKIPQATTQRMLTLKSILAVAKDRKQNISMKKSDHVTTSTVLPIIQHKLYKIGSSNISVKHSIPESNNTSPKSKKSLISIENLLKYFKLEDAPFKDYSLNVSLSQTFPINRSFPDVRPRQCLGRKYSPSNRKVSVIIPFYNEMWSVLLRTVNSILSKSPPSLLHEILLIDDNSNFSNLLDPLDSYLKNFPKVNVIRLPKREGLIRARMAGARSASGDILAFIDAHVEVNEGWLEPLIELVENEPTTIAVPVINSIDPLTFEYNYAKVKSQGTFSWDLDFVWRDENVFYDSIGIEPHPSATMIGCAFVVDKDFFFKIGYFDEGMNIWGGEQIEISFRTWMCGGALKVAPCSLVGHIYRAHLPYSFTETELLHNLQRIAEVWMDDYKRYYYYTIRQEPFTFSRSELIGIENRKKLRKSLNCRSFGWYLENLVPHIKPPPMGAVYFGNLKNVGSQMCLEEKQDHYFIFNEIRFNYCSLQTTSMTFTFTDTGTLVHNGMCLSFRNQMDSAVVLTPCDLGDNYQIWTFKPGIPDGYRPMVLGDDVKHVQGSIALKYGNYKLCLSQMLHNQVDILGALPCAAMNAHQFWIFTYRVNTQRSFSHVYDMKDSMVLN